MASAADEPTATHPATVQVGGDASKASPMLTLGEAGVRVVIPGNLSGCAVFAPTAAGFEGVKDTARAEIDEVAQSLWDQLQPVHNPSEEALAAMMAKRIPVPGTLLHKYDWAGKNFEVYSGTTEECGSIALRMQPFLTVLGPDAQSVDVMGRATVHCLFTVHRPDGDPDAWEVVGYTSADEVPCFPLTRVQLYVESLVVLPWWQHNLHGSVLVACMWQYATDKGFARVLWNEYKDTTQREDVDERNDDSWNFEDFARGVHLARMISLKIFRKYVPGHEVLGDAYKGDPAKPTWYKLREAKEAAYAKHAADLPQQLIWTRRNVDKAADLLLLPVCTVRELFEIQLLKASSDDTGSTAPKSFIKRRLFEMDKTNFRSIREDDIYYHLDHNFRETHGCWRLDMQRAMRLRQADVLPPFKLNAPQAAASPQ